MRRRNRAKAIAIKKDTRETVFFLSLSFGMLIAASVALVV